MNKGTYNINNLINFCNENNISLIKNYNDQKITRDTKIEGNCINNCINNFNKTFRQLKLLGGYCITCSVINKQAKAKQTCLQKYGVENPFQSEIIKNKIRETNIEKYGVETPFQSQEIQNKIKASNIEKYGVEYPIKSDIFRNKAKQTCLQKYGVENPFQSEIIKNKIKETNIEKYGVENPFQSEIIKNKIKASNIEKYGVEYPFQSEIIKNKSKQTCLQKYGVVHQMLSKEIQNKFKQTCLQKYGVENPSQDPEVVDKRVKNSYNRKTYTYPSGKQESVQGYEPLALDKLIKIELINENDIITGCKNTPIIWYNDENGKKHRHYVDIFIPSQNRCIEVKSTWTGKNLGFKYEIWIYDNKGNIVEYHE
jgi:hypothetical protein